MIGLKILTIHFALNCRILITKDSQSNMTEINIRLSLDRQQIDYWKYKEIKVIMIKEKHQFKRKETKSPKWQFTNQKGHILIM